MQTGTKKVVAEIRKVRDALRGLDRSLARAKRELAAGGDEPAVRRLKLSPARKKQLKLQGEYMGNMRRLSARARGRVKDYRERHGLRAAVQFAIRLRKGGRSN